MNPFVNKLIKQAKKEGIIPSGLPKMPPAYISCAELYLTFVCNDQCAHCITESGGKRKETLSPAFAHKAIDNIAKYSILNNLEKLFGNGTYRHREPPQCRELDEMPSPPKKLKFALMQKYNIAALGKGGLSEWVTDEGVFRLNFRKPTIRLSGGEFYMWPRTVDGKVLTEDERLAYQKGLIEKIRTALPQYNIWILTNGRFATSPEKSDKVVEQWAAARRGQDGDSKTRICISVDVFHRPPANTSIREMLERVWSSCAAFGFDAPHLYGIPNQNIGLTGRALEHFTPGKIEKHQIHNASGSTLNPLTYLLVDPNDLHDSDGCEEVKGFVVGNGEGNALVHNVFIAPTGRMVYCCACVGDYGDFINQPKECLESIITEPMALSLRRKTSVAQIMKLAAQMDPSIKIFGEGDWPEATGSTCYQILSGKRLNGRR